MAERNIAERVAELEQHLRRTRALLALALGLGLLPTVLAWRSAEPDVLRVRGIVVVDERRRERMFIGSPLPDPIEGRRIAPATGLSINDTLGVERFGLSLFPNGRVVMGFDAPRGTGDERNRERVSIVADERGNGYLRLLDRRTQARAFLQLNDDDEVSLDLLHWRETDIAVRRLRANGDTIEIVKR